MKKRTKKDMVFEIPLLTKRMILEVLYSFHLGTPKPEDLIHPIFGQNKIGFTDPDYDEINIGGLHYILKFNYEFPVSEIGVFQENYIKPLWNEELVRIPHLESIKKVSEQFIVGGAVHIDFKSPIKITKKGIEFLFIDHKYIAPHKPRCIVKDGIGFLQFSPGEKYIKIGFANSQHYKLLSLLVDNLWLYTTVDVIYDVINNNHSDKAKNISSSTYAKIKKIKSVIKEIQRGCKIGNKLTFRWGNESRTLGLFLTKSSGG